MEILAAHELSAQFDCIFGAGSKEDERLIKPLPELLRVLGVDTSDCLFVGDSALDIRSATHVGMAAIALLGGMGTRRSLRRCSPKVILENARQLVPYFAGCLHGT